jgi:hypothetical protein
LIAKNALSAPQNYTIKAGNSEGFKMFQQFQSFPILLHITPPMFEQAAVFWFNIAQKRVFTNLKWRTIRQFPEVQQRKRPANL